MAKQRRRSSNISSTIVTRSKKRELGPRRSSRLSHTNCIINTGSTTSSASITSRLRRRRKSSGSNGSSSCSTTPSKPKLIAPKYYLATTATGVWDADRKANFFYRQLRNCLKSHRNFRYGPDYETRTCIPSIGGTISWKVKSSGTSWIAVRDAKTACVVSINTIPEPDFKDIWTLLDCGVKFPPTANITVRKTLCEIGDMSHHLRKRIGQSSKKGPFAVVSVAPGTIGDHLESDKVSNAIDFLKAKLKNRLSLDFSEAEQIAVCALYHLFGPKFDSSKMEALGYGYGRGRIGISSSDVDKYLATINMTTNRDRLDFHNETSTVVAVMNKTVPQDTDREEEKL